MEVSNRIAAISSSVQIGHVLHKFIIVAYTEGYELLFIRIPPAIEAVRVLDIILGTIDKHRLFYSGEDMEMRKSKVVSSSS